MTKSSLGSDDPEIARLEAQAELLRDPTQVLLERSGISAGMRVLDLGTGLGHVAGALADLVGPDGQIVGLDIGPRMLEVARARTRHLPHVRIVEGDVTSWRDDQSFDAVVGRLILFHLPDPVGALRDTDPTIGSRLQSILGEAELRTSGGSRGRAVPLERQFRGSGDAHERCALPGSGDDREGTGDRG